MALRLLSGVDTLIFPGYALDAAMLYEVVVAESTKTYHTHHVDRDNAEGLFAAYKHFSARMADLVKEMAPQYPYPQALVNILLEASKVEWFFSEHLPSLTELDTAKGRPEQLYYFLEGITFRTIGSLPPSDSEKLTYF